MKRRRGSPKRIAPEGGRGRISFKAPRNRLVRKGAHKGVRGMVRRARTRVRWARRAVRVLRTVRGIRRGWRKPRGRRS